jgi:curved DNA-binding protein CbpA
MAKKKPLDLKGYYRLLKVSPEAPVDEIRLAYAMVKQEAVGPYLKRLEAAYRILKDPKAREAYDKEGLSTFNPLKSPATLVVSIVLLITIFFWLWLPQINLRRKSFSPGQTLVEMRTGREFGRVVSYESSHAFPGGATSPAYLVRMGETGSERWIPAIDLQATCDGQ